MELSLTKVDYAVILIYLVAILIICGVAARRTKHTGDLFLAGRSLGWLPIGFSLFASNISSTTLIGLAGAAYTWGIAVANYEWMASVVLIFLAVFFIPLYLEAKVTTIPEFLGKRFDQRSRRYFSGLTLLANVLIDMAGGLFAGAVVVQMFFPSIDLQTACIAIAVFSGLYTVAGGLAAVVYTDVLQAIILLLGSCLITFFAFSSIDFQWTMVTNELDSSRLSLILPLSDPNLPWLGTLIGVPILGFYFWGTNQFITQRILAARSVQDARWGALFAGLLKLPVIFIMILPGTMAVIFLPDLPSGDMVFPVLVQTVLPAGLVGLVLACLISAIMSSVDSTLNSASTLVTYDFIKPRWPELNDKALNRIGRIAILCFMTFSALFAPLLVHFGGLFQYLQTALAYLMPPVAVVFILGVLWRRGTAAAAFWTLIISHTFSLVIFVLSQLEIITLHFTIIAGLLFGFGAIIFVAISLNSAKPTPAQVCFTFRRALARDDHASTWLLDYRFLSFGLMVLTIALVLTFW